MLPNLHRVGGQNGINVQWTLFLFRNSEPEIRLIFDPGNIVVKGISSISLLTTNFKKNQNKVDDEGNCIPANLENLYEYLLTPYFYNLRDV